MGRLFVASRFTHLTQGRWDVSLIYHSGHGRDLGAGIYQAGLLHSIKSGPYNQDFAHFLFFL